MIPRRIPSAGRRRHSPPGRYAPQPFLNSTPALVYGPKPKQGDLYRQFADRKFHFFAGETPHPSRILRKFSRPGQLLGELYEEMLDDGYLAAMVEKRLRALACLPWSIEPGDGSSAARESADFCLQVVRKIHGLDILLDHQFIGAINEGFAPDELVWDETDLGFCPVRSIDRGLCDVGFVGDRLHYRSRDGLIPVAPGKFLARTHGTSRNPWGKALLDRAFKPWKLKRHATAYSMVDMERYAVPTPVGKYVATGDDGKDRAMAALLHQTLRQISVDAVAAVPTSVELDLLESKRPGTPIYLQHIEYVDRVYALLYSCEVDTSGGGKGPGSYAKAEVSQKVRGETTRMDARVMEQHYSTQLLAPLTFWNFSPDVPVPVWKYDTSQLDDKIERREAAAEFVEKYDLPIPEADLYAAYCQRPPRENETAYRLRRAEA